VEEVNKLNVFISLFALGAILLLMPVFASPVINNITFNLSNNITFNLFANIWTGESPTLLVNCTDDENYNITNVYAQIIGKDGYRIPDKNLNNTTQDGLYTTPIESLYLNKPNVFSVNVFCVNNLANQTNQTTNFTVSNFSTSIAAINPSTIYLGDLIEIDISVKRNFDEPITSNVSFNLSLDNQTKIPKVPPSYEPSKGWIIYLDSPSSSGTYTLKITTFYDRVNDTKTASLTINDQIQFAITNIDKTWVKPGDAVNLQIQAFDRGNKISINTNNLAVQVGSVQATITSITPVNNYYNVVVQMPDVPSGSYALTALLSYNNYTNTSSKTVYYIIPVSGKIVDENGKGTAAQIFFLSNNVEKLRLNTDSNGAYSGNLPPGTYDIKVVFPQSVLYLNDVSVSSFEDPIKYYYLTSADIPGLSLAGVYVYETTLSYSRASMEMTYDERNVLNENLIKVYRCEDWNTGKKTCYSSWSEIVAYTDTKRNIVYVNNTGLSAYAVGTLKSLSPVFNLNKEKFYLKDLVSIRGVVSDDYGNAVNNVSIRVYVKGTSIDKKIFSDSNGVFLIEFLSPEKEGNYSLVLSAEKYPYLSFNSSMNFEVVRSREISIVFPDTVKIEQGGSFTQDFTLVNTGQSDITGLNISLDGIPSWYYSLTPFIQKLNASEEKKLSIYFSIPSNASSGTSSATLKVFNDEVSKEKIFGFTIVGKNQTIVSPAPATGLFGKIVLPQITPEPVYILIFAAIAFSLAFILKRRKVKNQRREDIENLLLDIKGYMEKKEALEALQKTSPSTPTETEELPEEEETEEIKGIG
jgi:hypothetical protein